MLRRERLASGWTQRRLAEAIGVSQSLVCRYETVTAPRPRVDVYAKAFAILEVAIQLDARRLGEARRRDRAHAFVLAYVLRRLPGDWLTDTEVAVRAGRRSGWIDLLVFQPRTGTLLVVEIKTEADDIGQILRTLRWHTDQALAAAHSRGWRPRSVIPVLVVLMTHDAVERLVEARPLLRAALPCDPSDLLAVLRSKASSDGTGYRSPGYVALFDPRSRREDWLMPIPVAGRPQRIRWRGYADFARSIDGRRIRRPPSLR